MIKTLNWNVITSLNGSMSEKYKPDTILDLHLTQDDDELRVKRFKYVDFLKIMWKLFDSSSFVKKFSLYHEKELIYEYQFMESKEDRPTMGDGNIILSFKTMTPAAKSVYIDLLISQIMEFLNDNNSGSV